MIAVEVRNMYVSYDNKDERSCDKKQSSMASLYLIRQLVRMVEIKQLKNAAREVELLIPDNIAKTLQRMDNDTGGSTRTRRTRRP